MHSLLVLIDGLGDNPIPFWQGKTPFQHAEHQTMDILASVGSRGYFSICEDDIIPESCSCILRLLGVNKKDMPRNRAYLELLAYNRDISEYEMVLRCNLAVIDKKDNLVAFNGRGLTAKQMKAAANACNNILPEIEFIHLSEYRNLLIMDKQPIVLDCHVQPPHESLGEHVENLLEPLKQKSFVLSYFLELANKKLSSFSYGGFRYILYPWGAAARQKLPSFFSLHGIKGGVVCKAEIVAGMAKALDMELLIPPGVTGDIDTDIISKAKGTMKLLKDNTFVITHFNGADEAAHRYDYQAKSDFISRIDKEFLQFIAAAYKEPLKILICGDHATSSLTGKHTKGATPVIAGYLNFPNRSIRLNNYCDILDFLMKESD